MKTNSLTVVSARSRAFALLVCLAGLPAGAAVFDDFESYAVGSNLHGQGGWSGWAGNPGAGALVSTSFSFSPTRAVNVTGAADLVRTFSGVTNGQWVCKVMQYIPSTSSGTNYVVLLNRYQPPFTVTDLNWSVQIQNNLDTGQIISDLGAGASRPMVKNQWVEIRVEVNLASNTVAEFYNGQLLSTHVWQDGSGLNELQALDLFADNSGPVYYDNVNLAPAAPPAPALRIASHGPNLEGLPTFKLEWEAISNATYLVQSTDSLAPGTVWTTLDAVFVPDKAGSYQIQVVAMDSTGLLSPTKFYRLVLPQTKILSVEPAVVAPGVPVDFYVIGQCFPTNAQLRIKGLPQSGTLYQSSTTLVQPSFTPDVPGDYQFDLVVGGVVVSSFTVVCADVAVSPELVLQGPPTMEPPASPQLAVLIAPWLSRKGYEYYRAKSDMSAAGLHNNPYFAENSMAGDMPTHGSHLSKRGYDYYKAQSDVTYDVQEGKKGLNAVNVKLARTSGGGGTIDLFNAWPSGYHPPVLTAREPGRRLLWGLGGNVEISSIAARRVVMPFSGEVEECDVDLAIPGRGLDFIWARTYRSRPGNQGVINFTVTRWTHSYDVVVAQTAAGIAVADGTGRLDTFKLQTNGTYTCPQFFREGTLSNNTFTLTFADTGRWVFNPFDSSPAAGKLRQIITRNGDTMTLGYDTSGRLAQIVDDLDRTNTIAYNTSGQLASVTDFSGRTVRYEYDGHGDLVACVSPPILGTPNGNDFPGGKTNRYTYSSGYLDDRENHLLLSVIDPTGQAIYKHVYQHNETNLEFLRCISVQHWTNTPTMISYLPQTPTPTNGFATLRCIVNDPVGNVTECFTDARGRPVKMQEFTGRATPGATVTATVNRPTGKLRAEDPDYYECSASWNNDSLCNRLIMFGGGQLQCVYECDFDKSTRARKRADCRVVREIASSPVDLDGDGVADVTERAWRYTYDPRFGSDPTPSYGKKLYVGNLPFSSEDSARKGWDGTIKGREVTSVRIIKDKETKRFKGWDGTIKGGGGRESAKVITDRDTGRSKGFGFIVSATDPRGNVTTGTYDAKGNRVKVRFYWDRQSSADADFAYDSYGQLTAITNAPDANGRRSVDTFTYSQGQVVQCVEDAGAGGLALTGNYEYDARGNLTRCIDPRTNDWLCTYNSLDQLVQTESAVLGSGGPGGYRIKTQFSYDANDNLTLVAEENRDAKGTLGTNPFWRTQFVYDGGQRLTGCWRDKNGALVLRCTEVKYNAANQVVLYRSPEAVNGNDPLNTVAYEYDERGLDYRTIAAPGSPVQSTTQCDYDANGNVTRVSEGLEGTPSITTMECDGFAGFARWTPIVPKPQEPVTYRLKVWQLMQGQNATSGRQARFEEAVRTENVSSRLRSEASSLQFEHGDMDRPVVLGSMWGSPLAKGNTSIGAAYMGINRLSKITDPMGNVTTCNYDANDNLKVIRQFGQTNDVPGTNGNIRLAESRYEYDGLDRPIRSRDSFFSLPSQAPIGDGERTTTFAYAPNGQCTNVMDDLGRVTTFAYDTACRLSSVSSPGGKSVYAVFRDAAGKVARETQTDQSDLGGPPQVFAGTNVFDSLGRCVSTTDNVGNSNSFAYDSHDNCVRSTDPNGNVTVYAYDGLSRPVSSTSYQGATTTIVSSSQFAYDDNDRCTSSTDANGNVALHAYDSQDRLTQTTQADGTHHTLVWSPRSNLIQETDANGTVINRTYDLNDRCISNNITPGAGVAATTTFETFAYDGASRLVNANNDGSQNAFEYDSLGSCTRGVSGGVGAVVSPHDSVGRRTSLTYPGGRVLTYAYDSLDQCTNILETSVSLASFAYDGPGRVARIAYANGMRTRIFYDGISGVPNASGDFGHGQISRILHAMNGGSPQISEVRLAWDRKGNKTKRDDAIFQPAIPRTNSLMLDYDGADRLTEAAVLRGSTLLRDTVYGLDLMGNRTNVTGAASCSGSYTMSSTIPPGDSQMNRYSATPCDTRTYDSNGNLVSRSSPTTGPTTYSYDYADRLVQVQAVDFSSGSLVITTSSYAYDALGRRVSKTVFSGGLPPVTTQYVYDVTPYKDGEANELRSRVIEERQNGAVAASFVLDGSRSPDDGVVQMRRRGQDYYFHTDDQGNVLALTGPNGAVVERCDYDDYGKVTFFTSDGLPTSATASAVGNPYCWGGLRLDAESGLQNDDGGGYFEPQTGRKIAPRNIAPYRLRVAGPTTCGGNNPWSGGGGGGGGIKAKAEKNMTLKGQKILQN